MLKSASHVRKHLRGNPFALHLAPFATSMRASGYTVGTVQWKLVMLAAFGRWLRKTGRIISQLDEQCTDDFLKQKHGVHRAEANPAVSRLSAKVWRDSEAKRGS